MNVLLCEPFSLESTVFELWFTGFTVEEAVSQRLEEVFESDENVTYSDEDRVRLLSLFQRDTSDSFRTFGILEDLLCDPPKLLSYPVFQISFQARRFMIERYYGFETSVFRELIGKKLNAKTRKDLEDVSKKTGVRLPSCKRQFDNLKTISQAVEDLPGPVVENIQRLFLLSKDLAGKYARVVFLCTHRMETSKKKLSMLSYDDFDFFASLLLLHWTEPNSAKTGLDLDPVFVEDLKTVKQCLTNNRGTIEEYRHLFKSSFKKNNLTKFTPLLKTLVGIAASIQKAKEVSSFFINLVDYAEKLKSADMSHEEVNLFFDLLIDTFDRLSIKVDKNLSPAWGRFVRVFKTCLVHLYDRVTATPGWSLASINMGSVRGTLFNSSFGTSRAGSSISVTTPVL
eukprot:GILJ01005293.1.p1 GENE.GILJ01005293.1~~GILJ01005293.1.p1  ORF type:complete len:407 (-),score=70.69 GILJ01005293.1:159-1352(-)